MKTTLSLTLLSCLILSATSAYTMQVEPNLIKQGIMMVVVANKSGQPLLMHHLGQDSSNPIVQDKEKSPQIMLKHFLLGISPEGCNKMFFSSKRGVFELVASKRTNETIETMHLDINLNNKLAGKVNLPVAGTVIIEVTAEGTISLHKPSIK